MYLFHTCVSCIYSSCVKCACCLCYGTGCGYWRSRGPAPRPVPMGALIATNSLQTHTYTHTHTYLYTLNMFPKHTCVASLSEGGLKSRHGGHTGGRPCVRVPNRAFVVNREVVVLLFAFLLLLLCFILRNRKYNVY